MNDEGIRSISRAVEELALALGEGGAVPRGELVRALERAADRLRGTPHDGPPPTDLVSQAAAARGLGVSRQAVNQWVRKGILETYVAGNGTGRAVQLVSLGEIAVVANRRSAERFSETLRDQLITFLDAVAPIPGLGPVTEGVAASLQPGIPSGLSDVGSRVLREFFVGAMGSAATGEEFTKPE